MVPFKGSECELLGFEGPFMQLFSWRINIVGGD